MRLELRDVPIWSRLPLLGLFYAPKVLPSALDCIYETDTRLIQLSGSRMSSQMREPKLSEALEHDKQSRVTAQFEDCTPCRLIGMTLTLYSMAI